MIKDYLSLTMKNLRNRKMRSWLTVLGVIIGVMAIVALISVGQGMQNAIEEQFEKLGVSNIRIVPGGLNGPPNEAFFLTQDTVDYIETIRGVDYANPILIRSTTVKYAREEQFLSVTAEDTEVSGRGFADLDIKPIEGRTLQPGDKYSAIVGHTVAFDRFEQDIKTKTSIEINGIKFKVVGVMEETGGETDSRIYIPISTAREIFNAKDQANGIIVHIEPGLDIYEMQELLDRRLERKLGEDEYKIFTPDQILQQIGSVLGAVQGVLVAIAAISILVGAVGIMNSMYTSVLERTREIGVMKSIGATRGNILLVFLIEAGLVGITGGIIGAILGSLLAFGIELGAKLGGFNLLSVSIDPSVILFSLLLAMIVGMVSGFFPALRASRLKPVDALHYE